MFLFQLRILNFLDTMFLNLFYWSIWKIYVDFRKNIAKLNPLIYKIQFFDNLTNNILI